MKKTLRASTVSRQLRAAGWNTRGPVRVTGYGTVGVWLVTDNPVYNARKAAKIAEELQALGYVVELDAPVGVIRVEADPRCTACRQHPGWSTADESRRREPADVCRACLGSGREGAAEEQRARRS